MVIHAPAESRTKPDLGKIINLLLIAGPLLNIHGLLSSLPSFLQAIFVILIAAYLVKRLLTFPRWSDEIKHVGKFIKAVLVLLTVVIIENFCTWATSASDIYKYQYTPLQDNVEIGLRWAFRNYPIARRLIMGWRVDMHWLLYSFISLCLSVMWDQVPYSGFGMAARFMDTIAWAHGLRTLAFMITVLPNPQHGCYASNFPPVPQSVLGFLAVGFSAKRGSGCNDLVISGHGVVYAVVPLALQTFYPQPLLRGSPAAVAWLGVAKLCLQEVVDKTHYSVDMLLAVAVTVLVWHWRRGMYPETAMWHRRKPNSSADPVPYKLIYLILGILILVLVGVKGV